jgi:hypothetical protein
VAFDFDGTLTVRDSFMAFIAWRSGGPRFLLGMIQLIPAALAYLIHRDRGLIKMAAVRIFLGGLDRKTLEASADGFARAAAGMLFRPDALAAWNGWGTQGATRVICTAMVEDQVPGWMKAQGVPGGWLTAEYSMLPYATLDRKARDISRGKLDGRTTEIQRLIGRALRAVVDCLGKFWLAARIYPPSEAGTRAMLPPLAVAGGGLAIMPLFGGLVPAGLCALVVMAAFAGFAWRSLRPEERAAIRNPRALLRAGPA